MRKGLFFLSAILVLSIIFGYFCQNKFKDLLSENNRLNQINEDLTNENEHLKELNSRLLENTSVDKNEEICIANSRNNIEILNCCVEAEKYYDNEIDKYLTLLKETLPGKEFELINKNQQSWYKHNYSDKEIINSFIGNKGGSLYIQLAADDIVILKKQRALFLKNIYEYRKESESDSE